jgi:hypothetical protein
MKRRIWFAAPAVACALAACLVASPAAAQDMPHEAVPYACTKCHTSVEDQTEIEFDHSELDFELVGRHETVACARCHDLADFTRADDRCMNCHTDVHQGRLYPECDTCHSPEGWDVIDSYGAHSRTAFQLFGAHVRLDCDACHEREIVAERAQLGWDCYECHRADYEANQLPPHDAYRFPTTCEQCHRQIEWKPAMIREHPCDFPIFSGTHAGLWDGCTTCHGSQGTWLPFSCFGCHEHNEADMAETHAEVPFYWYDSYGCFGCHPMGIAEEVD